MLLLIALLPTHPDDIDKLLSRPSIKERERNKVGNEIVELLERQSVKEKSLIAKVCAVIFLFILLVEHPNICSHYAHSPCTY